MSHFPQYPAQQQPTIPLVGFHQQPEQKGYAQVNQYASVPSLQPDYSKNIEEQNKWKKLAKEVHHRHKAMAMTSRGLSVILNMLMFAFMALTLIVFYTTRDEFALGRDIWPKNRKDWPTILLLGASFLTFVGSLITLIIYCCCFKRAAESWKLAFFGFVIQIGAWLVVTFLYRYEKRLNDLWGWSCSSIATKLQNEGNASVDFHKLCTIQVSFLLQYSSIMAEV
jgi:hypothetical protein